MKKKNVIETFHGCLKVGFGPSAPPNLLSNVYEFGGPFICWSERKGKKEEERVGP